MTSHSPIKPRASLIERAAEVYDFAAEMRARAPLAMPAADPLPILPATPLEGFIAPVAPMPANPRPYRPAFQQPKQPVDRLALAEAGFLVPDLPPGPLAEEFRIVKRALLLAAAADPKARIILIASAQPNEGKSFCAVNLALSLAGEKDNEVLLVDGDFAKPEILSTLGLASGPGLIDAIADPAIDIESCVIPTDIPHLAVLPAGRRTHEATELIASAATHRVIERLAEREGRIILIDSPPVLAASPASVLALHAGQTVLVVRADQTSETELREAVAHLSGCAEIRLLLNGTRFAPNGRRFGNYYGDRA